MSRLIVVLSTLLVVLSCSSISADFSPNNYNVNCEMYNYWVYVPLPRTLVSSWLPKNLQFDQHPFPTLANDQWPILLEFNMPTNCFVKTLPFIKQSMLEWKLEVPYLRQSGLAAPLMFKPVTIMNNWLNSVATYFQYGINAVFTNKMNTNNQTNPGTYSITVSGKGMSATFTNVVGQETFVPITNTSYGTPYIFLNDETEWIGYNILRQQQCAKIYYQWQETTVRPVIANIHFDAEFLPNSKHEYDLTSIDGAKAIQIRSLEHITNLAACTKTAKTNSLNADGVEAPNASINNNNNNNISTGTVIGIAAASSVVTTLLVAIIIIAVIRRRNININKHQQTVSHIEQHTEPTVNQQV